MKKLFRIMFISCLFLSVLNGAYAMGQMMFMTHPLEGKESPDFTLDTIHGEKLNLTEFRDGKPAIIFFWATWCPHCRGQLKELDDMSASLENKGIKLVLIDLEENKRTVENFMRQYKNNLDVCLDKDGKVSDKYSIIGVPSFFLVNKEGVVNRVEYQFPENYEAILSQ